MSRGDQVSEEYMDDTSEEAFRGQVGANTMPVSSPEQLGQSILRTHARTSDPEQVKYIKLRKKTPVFDRKIVIDENGQEVEVEFIKEWKEVEWEEPIMVQPKYHELITDDVATAFLAINDYYLYQDNGNYCQMVRSFASRYGLDLAPHYNNFADMTNLMVVGSGAVKGQRVKIAKSNIAETSFKSDSSQVLGPRPQKKKKGLLGSLGL